MSTVSGMTRANIDQYKRTVRQQLHGKVQVLDSLRENMEKLLTSMQQEIDSVSAQLQAHQGYPIQLVLNLHNEFNTRSSAVQNVEVEMRKIKKEIAELHQNLKGATVTLKSGQKSPNTCNSTPIKPCTVSRPRQPTGLLTEESEVMGFPVNENQFTLLSETEDEEVTDEQEISVNAVVPEVSTYNETPTFLQNSLSVSPVEILSAKSTGNFELEIGDFDDAMYESDLMNVCTKLADECKRITVAGPEWSAGRPDNRSIGARTAAPEPSRCLIGPYATDRQVQTQNTKTAHQKVQAAENDSDKLQMDNTNQQTPSSSRKQALEDQASPTTAVLQPRKPPCFSGQSNEDVHVWTSIIDRWLGYTQGEKIQQLTYIVSLLREHAYEWYSSYETQIGCPGDWETLKIAMPKRFGLSIRVNKARAMFLQLTQDKMTVLQYADKFESCLAQIEDYNEQFYLTKFIFGLSPAILTEVFIQHPVNLLEAKRIAEEIELIQSMCRRQQHGDNEKKANKNLQHRGTQQKGSVHKMLQTKKTWQRLRQYIDSQKIGCKSAQQGAQKSCQENHGPAAKWRLILKDLPLRDRAGYVRRHGSIVTVSLEALTHEKERKSADTTVAGMYMHSPSGGPKAPRVYLRNRLLRRDKERKARDCVRERQLVTSLLETQVSPMSGGTGSCEGVTISALQGWQSRGLRANADGGEGSSVPTSPQTQLYAVSHEDQPKNPRKEDDGILLIVPARVFGHEIRALIDSGATRCFISPAAVTKCALEIETHNTFLELGDGTKVLSRGRAVNVPIVTAGFSAKLNLTVCSLLHDVDIVLGMTWLKAADPLIRWSTGTMYLPDSVTSLQTIMGEWIDQQVKVGTVKVLSTNEDLESLRQASNTVSLQILKSPKFWAVKAQDSQRTWRNSHAQGSAQMTAKFFELNHPSFGMLKVQKLNKNAALPKRSTEGAAGYDLCASHGCTIPVGGNGLVKTGLAIAFPAGLYARIAPRSGLALKKFINVGAGVVDSDYRGDVGVVLFNHGDQDFEVKMGDRIAQMIFEKIDTPVYYSTMETKTSRSKWETESPK